MFFKLGKCYKLCKYGDIRDLEGLYNIFFMKCMVRIFFVIEY